MVLTFTNNEEISPGLASGQKSTQIFQFSFFFFSQNFENFINLFFVGLSSAFYYFDSDLGLLTLNS